MRPAPLAAYRCNVLSSTVAEAGLTDFAARQVGTLRDVLSVRDTYAALMMQGIDYWGGFPQGNRSQYNKIVATGCRGGKILSFYVFMPVSSSFTHDREEEVISDFIILF